MDITLDKKNAIEASIKIKVNESDYQPKVEEKVKEYARKANIKGFRPGKVPVGMIKKMYGKAIIVEEVNDILSKSLGDFIKEKDLQILGDPLPDLEKSKDIDWENQRDFEFDYEIGLAAEFEYDLSKKQKVKHYVIDVNKKVLDETIDNLKEQFGDIEYPEVSEEGDTLLGEIKELNGDLSNETEITIENVEKKERNQFIGLKESDIIEFDLKKVFKDAATISSLIDVSTEKAEGLDGKFQFSVTGIERPKPAEINQDLFDKVFGKEAVKNEQEFIDKVKETVEQNYSKETSYFLNQSIIDHFVSKTKMEVPEEFLKRWLLRSNEGKVTMEDIDKDYQDFEKGLRWDLIKAKIAKDLELKVENEEVVAKAKDLIIQQFGGPSIAAQFGEKLDEFANNYLQGENGQNYMRVYNQVREEKIMEAVKSNITLQDKRVSLDEFRKIIQN